MVLVNFFYRCVLKMLACFQKKTDSRGMMQKYLQMLDISSALTELDIPHIFSSERDCFVWNSSYPQHAQINLQGSISISENTLGIVCLDFNRKIPFQKLAGALRWANNWNRNCIYPKVFIDPIDNMFVAECDYAVDPKMEKDFLKEQILNQAVLHFLNFFVQAEEFLREESVSLPPAKNDFSSLLAKCDFDRRTFLAECVKKCFSEVPEQIKNSEEDIVYEFSGGLDIQIDHWHLECRKEGIRCLVSSQKNIPPEKRKEVLVFLNKINNLISHGCLTWNEEDNSLQNVFFIDYASVAGSCGKDLPRVFQQVKQDFEQFCLGVQKIIEDGVSAEEVRAHWERHCPRQK